MLTNEQTKQGLSEQIKKLRQTIEEIFVLYESQQGLTNLLAEQVAQEESASTIIETSLAMTLVGSKLHSILNRLKRNLARIERQYQMSRAEIAAIIFAAVAVRAQTERLEVSIAASAAVQAIAGVALLPNQSPTPVLREALQRYIDSFIVWSYSSPGNEAFQLSCDIRDAQAIILHQKEILPMETLRFSFACLQWQVMEEIQTPAYQAIREILEICTINPADLKGEQ